MDLSSGLAPQGTLTTRVIGRPPARPVVTSVEEARRYGTPQATRHLGSALAVPPAVAREAVERAEWQEANQGNFRRSLDAVEAFEAGWLRILGTLWARHVRRDGSVLDLGLVSCRVVTNVGAAFLVDAIQGLVEPELLRYHGLGTGTAAEAVGNTALGAELTTQYAVANTRPTGSLGEKSGDSRTFETSATITVSASVAATEHGLFTQAATGGGVLFDRSVFSVVNLASAESLQVTYQATIPSGG